MFNHNWPTASIVLNEENLKAFLLKLGENKNVHSIPKPVQ